MSREFKEWYFNRMNPYHDINNSNWFKDIVKNACQNSERRDNRIKVYFGSFEDQQNAIKECERRNISYIEYACGECSSDKIWKLDIMMNWKKRLPSRLKRNKEQILD